MIRLLSDPADYGVVEDPELWKSIKEEAGRHGIAPLIAYAARGRLDGIERAWCDRVLTRSWSRFGDSLANLEFATKWFTREGIRAVALKGPCLALRYYQPPFLRKPSVDLDFAVGSKDFERACTVLRGAGYSQHAPADEAQEFSHHLVFMHPVRSRIEVHFRLTHGPRGIPVDEFLPRAISYRLPGGGQTWILSPADEILQLGLHVASSRFAPFFHLYELHRVCAEARTEDIGRAVRRAAGEHFAGALWMIDVAFRSIWGEPFLPRDAMPQRTWLQWRLNERLYFAFDDWSKLEGEHTLGSRLRGRWLDLQTSDGPFDALRQLKSLARFARVQMLRRGWRNLPVGGVRPAR